MRPLLLSPYSRVGGDSIPHSRSPHPASPPAPRASPQTPTLAIVPPEGERVYNFRARVTVQGQLVSAGVLIGKASTKPTPAGRSVSYPYACKSKLRRCIILASLKADAL